MMGKQGRGSFSSGKAAGSSTGVKKKKMVIKPFKVRVRFLSLPRSLRDGH